MFGNSLAGANGLLGRAATLRHTGAVTYAAGNTRQATEAAPTDEPVRVTARPVTQRDANWIGAEKHAITERVLVLFAPVATTPYSKDRIVLDGRELEILAVKETTAGGKPVSWELAVAGGGL